MIEIKVRADQVQKDDVLAAFGWAVGDIRQTTNGVALTSADGKHSTAFPTSLTVRVLRKTQTPLVEQWRQLAADMTDEVKRATSDPVRAGLTGVANTYADCANQLDEWMTRLRTLLDSWDAEIRRNAATLSGKTASGETWSRLDAMEIEQAQLQRCAAELRKLLQLPAPQPAVPVEDQCGEGPHGQPCGQRVDHGVCPDHGEVGP